MLNFFLGLKGMDFHETALSKSAWQLSALYICNFWPTLTVSSPFLSQFFFKWFFHSFFSMNSSIIYNIKIFKSFVKHHFIF